jgi:hypothetical protein
LGVNGPKRVIGISLSIDSSWVVENGFEPSVGWGSLVGANGDVAGSGIDGGDVALEDLSLILCNVDQACNVFIAKDVSEDRDRP